MEELGCTESPLSDTSPMLSLHVFFYFENNLEVLKLKLESPQMFTSVKWGDSFNLTHDFYLTVCSIEMLNALAEFRQMFPHNSSSISRSVCSSSNKLTTDKLSNGPTFHHNTELYKDERINEVWRTANLPLKIVLQKLFI